MSLESEFAAFWQAYPRRVAKLAALKAYEKARKLASAEAILAGVQRYKQAKPEYADWCHPTTFLNQGRWLDEYEEAPRPRWQAPAATDWWEDCKRLHGGACEKRFAHELRMRQEGAA